MWLKRASRVMNVANLGELWEEQHQLRSSRAELKLQVGLVSWYGDYTPRTTATATAVTAITCILHHAQISGYVGPSRRCIICHAAAEDVRSQKQHDNTKFLVPTDGSRLSERMTRAINILEQVLVWVL